MSLLLEEEYIDDVKPRSEGSSVRVGNGPWSPWLLTPHDCDMTCIVVTCNTDNEIIRNLS